MIIEADYNLNIICCHSRFTMEASATKNQSGLVIDLYGLSVRIRYGFSVDPGKLEKNTETSWNTYCSAARRRVIIFMTNIRNMPT